MKKETFYISVNEILSRTISVSAESIEEALIIADNLYNQEKIVLDYNDFLDYEINDLHQCTNDEADFTADDVEV